MIIPKKFKDSGELQDSYERGYRAGYFGADGQNSHFSIFNKPEKTKAWEAGNDAGSNAREKILAKAEAKKAKKK